MARQSQPQKQLATLLRAQCPHLVEEDNSLPGTPDIVFPDYKLVVFFHGCFWHGHGCRDAPKSALWRSKIDVRKIRDEENRLSLKSLGYTVEVVWECHFQENPILEVQRIMSRIYFIGRSP